jgi:hypothetical protein
MRIGELIRRDSAGIKLNIAIVNSGRVQIKIRYLLAATSASLRSVRISLLDVQAAALSPSFRRPH